MNIDFYEDWYFFNNLQLQEIIDEWALESSQPISQSTDKETEAQIKKPLWAVLRRSWIWLPVCCCSFCPVTTPSGSSIAS